MKINGIPLTLGVAAKVTGGDSGRRVGTDLNGVRHVIQGRPTPLVVDCDGEGGHITTSDAAIIQALYDAGLPFTVEFPRLAADGGPLTGTGVILNRPELVARRGSPHTRYKFQVTFLSI